MPDKPFFEIGATVQLSEEARAKAKIPMRRGIVLGFSKTGHQARVHWDGVTRSQLIHVTLLVVAHPPASSQR